MAHGREATRKNETHHCEVVRRQSEAAWMMLQLGSAAVRQEIIGPSMPCFGLGVRDRDGLTRAARLFALQPLGQ